MKRLVGTFHVPAPLLLRGNGETRCIKSLVDGFDVELRIAPDLDMRSRAKRERLWNEGCVTLELSVARDETEAPPEPLITPSGGRDWTTQTPYFDERTAQYSQAACRAVNNAISFFKYELRQPLLAPIPENSNFFVNPEWSDEEGNQIHGGRKGIILAGVPGWRGDLGVKKLGRRDLRKLARALAAPPVVPLHAEILSDAQGAAFEGNIRRAVLELAVACEVFVKETFLGSNYRASRVYEALEDGGKVSLRVLDLIDIGGAAVTGSSFRAHDPEAFRDIDNLFRARNRSAHRGKVTYRDDSGVHDVTFKVLVRWWTSAGKLFEWASRGGRQ